MAGFETAIAHENEIMKAQDVAFGYDAAISNIGAALKAILGNHAGDYVIGGFVKPFGTDTLQIAVEAAFIFCQSTGLCAAETDMTAPISLESADATFDRIDVVQVHAFKTEFSQQSRMFNDPISGGKRLRTVPTKKRIQFDVQIKKGANGSESAPKTDEGFVKLAEIRIPAGTQNLTAEMIRNVEARKSGGVNTLWTEDKTRTFNPGSLTDVFSTFLIAHNEDGSHKAKAIKKEHIDFGTSGDQIKGSDIPTGKSVRVHKKDFSQIADLTSVITALAESSNALPAYANDILSRYSYVSILPVAASTAPIDIKGGGEKTIDGVACKADMTVFLKDQTDARENGLYIVKAGAWARAAGFTEGAAFTDKLILIPAGTVNKGKIFYLASPVNTLGQDKLDFKASALSPYALANTVMTRDTDGRAKAAAPNAADDIARKAEVDAEARARADAVNTEAQARTQAVHSLTQAFQQAITNEAQARAEGDKSIVDFCDPAGKRRIQVGFSGNGLTAENTSHLAGFYNDGHGDNGNKIRDISKTEARKWLGIEASKDDVLVENAGWKAVIRPCQNGVELVIMDGMNRNQLWTRIAGGVMSLFVLGSITSCGGMYQGNTGAVKKGWEKKHSGTGVFFRSVACNGNTWVAVGPLVEAEKNAPVIVSTDNGNTWSTKKNGTWYSLTSVAWNGNTWVAVGYDGTIIASTDNGNNWSKKNNGVGDWLYSVAWNGNTWVAVGHAGTILRSSDTAVWE